MKEIAYNSELAISKTVTPDDSAIKVGSGLVDVFATPALIALCEKTSSQLLSEYLDEGEVSVGINVNIDHVAASKIGANVKCVATIKKIEGRKIYFDLVVYEKDKIVGKGQHIRCVVNKQKFLERLN